MKPFKKGFSTKFFNKGFSTKALSTKGFSPDGTVGIERRGRRRRVSCDRATDVGTLAECGQSIVGSTCKSIKSKKVAWVLILLVIVFKHPIKIKTKTCSYTFNTQRYTSMSFHIVAGIGRYTTSTTNMYHKYQHVLHGSPKIVQAKTGQPPPKINVAGSVLTMPQPLFPPFLNGQHRVLTFDVGWKPSAL